VGRLRVSGGGVDSCVHDGDASRGILSQAVFIKSFCKSQVPHKSVNLSFIITNVKNKLTDLCGNGLLKNDFINTFCEMGLDNGTPQTAGKARLSDKALALRVWQLGFRV